MISTVFSDSTNSTMIYNGGLTKEVFRSYCKHKLSKEAPKGSIIVFDNLNVHYDKDAIRFLTKKGLTVIYLPKYSPDLNPIEKIWSFMKKKIRDSEPREKIDTANAMREGFKLALKHLNKYFSSCGLILKKIIDEINEYYVLEKFDDSEMRLAACL